MTDRTAGTPQRQAAMVAGFGLLTMALLAFFAQFFVLEGLIVPGDAATTARNITANDLLFRLGITGWLGVLVCDVFVAWGLYVLLRPVDRNLSLLTAWFRLVYTAIHGAALVSLLLVLVVLQPDVASGALPAEQSHALVSLLLAAREYGSLLGLVFFGFHLFLLGHLVIRSGYVPRFLGYFLLVASAGYVMDSLAHFLLQDYESYAAVFTMLVAVPGVIGELSFMVWLLFRGGKNTLTHRNQIAFAG